MNNANTRKGVIDPRSELVATNDSGNRPVFAQVDTTGRPIRTVTADGQVVGGGGTAAYWFAGTWAGLQAATTADLALGTPTLNTGLNVAWVQDVGGPRGMEVQWTGTRWKTVVDINILSITAPIGFAENVASQLLTPAVEIPAGFLRPGDEIEVYLAASKSATGTATVTVNLRLGTTGTSSDQALVTLPFTSAAGIMGRYRLKVGADTTMYAPTIQSISAFSPSTTPAEHLVTTNTVSSISQITIPSLSSQTILTLEGGINGNQTWTLIDACVRVAR